jgi:SAM-dependent methyltransferase
VEIGCGSLGGFVPMLRSSGYEAVGVDPKAPAGEEYRRVEFEHVEPFRDVDAIVASASLHHVADPVVAVEHLTTMLARRGTCVVVEWDWEAFDEPTAAWCFDRLAPGAEGWLRRHRDAWLASGQPWGGYLRDWAQKEQLHSAGTLLQLLDERFDRRHLVKGAYFFPDLVETSEEDERAAIAQGEIRAARVDYAGVLREPQGRTGA